jgi:hypothetical protein
MEKVETAIREFHNFAIEMRELLDKMNELFSMEPEGNFYNLMFSLSGRYIKALDYAFSIGGWLEWWLLECDLGKKVMQAGLKDEPMRDIETLDDFIKIVCDDLKSADIAEIKLTEFSGYYYEIQAVIEDAVHCGAQAAIGIEEKLPSEIVI